MILTNILQQLQKEGYLINKKDVAHLSPYLTTHVKRFGDYLLNLAEVPPSLEQFQLGSLLQK